MGGVRLPGGHPGVFAAEVQGGVHPVQVPERPDDVHGREDGVVPAGLGACQDGELGWGYSLAIRASSLRSVWASTPVNVTSSSMLRSPSVGFS